MMSWFVGFLPRGKGPVAPELHHSLMLVDDGDGNPFLAIHATNGKWYNVGVVEDKQPVVVKGFNRS